MTVKEVSKLTGVSVRALHYYDEIGLLKPAELTPSGYRLYGSESLERLQQILLFRELEFSLKEIGQILDAPGFDRENALKEQIKLLKLKKEHFESLIAFAEQIESTGGNHMSFQVFDKTTQEKYKAQAKKKWGNTPAYREYEQKTAGYSDEKQAYLAGEMMAIFKEFGEHRQDAPTHEAVQALVKKLRDFITAHYYTCTDEILAGLGQMYAAGGDMTENIDAAGGEGTALFAARAIAAYCQAADKT